MSVQKKSIIRTMTALAFAALTALALTYSPLEADGCEPECHHNGYTCESAGNSNCSTGTEEESCLGTVGCTGMPWCGGSCDDN